jgi:hypothetical protein
MKTSTIVGVIQATFIGITLACIAGGSPLGAFVFGVVSVLLFI